MARSSPPLPLLAVAFALFGCGRPTLPDLVLVAEVRLRARGGALEEAWVARVNARWPLGVVAPDPPPPPPLPSPQTGSPGALPCASARLCAWEARRRREALDRLLPGGP